MQELAAIGYLLASLMVMLIVSGILSEIHKHEKISFISTLSILLAILSTAIFSIYSHFNMQSAISAYNLHNQQAAYSTFSAHAIHMLGILNISTLSSLFLVLFSSGLILIEILAYRNSKDICVFNMLLSFSAVGIFLVSTAYSLLMIFIAIELVSIPAALMILLGGKKNLEAATKLFILGAVSIAIFAFAMALLLPFNATLSLSPLSSNINYLSLLSMILFIAALSIEAALFPFNLWIPDVYQGSQGHITALLSGINKKVAFVAIIYILFIVFFSYRYEFSGILSIIAILTMFFGNLVAMVQKNIKRMLAYSSISQAGYILIGLAAISSYGLQASIYQLFAHMFMTIGAFSIVMWMESKNLFNRSDYKGMIHRNAFAAIAFTILMLSMAGIPPFMGFVGKFLLFSSAIQSNLLFLALIGIINSFISVYYYGKVINTMFQRSRRPILYIRKNISFVVMTSLIVIILVGIYPQPFMSVIMHAVSFIFH